MLRPAAIAAIENAARRTVAGAPSCRARRRPCRAHRRGRQLVLQIDEIGRHALHPSREQLREREGEFGVFDQHAPRVFDARNGARFRRHDVGRGRNVEQLRELAHAHARSVIAVIGRPSRSIRSAPSRRMNNVPAAAPSASTTSPAAIDRRGNPVASSSRTSTNEVSHARACRALLGAL
jgi:hypothetical protein